MIRTIDNIRMVAHERGLSAAQIARACDPPLPSVTVWRILNGKRSGYATTLQTISAAVDSLVAAPSVAAGEVVAQ